MHSKNLDIMPTNKDKQCIFDINKEYCREVDINISK